MKTILISMLCILLLSVQTKAQDKTENSESQTIFSNGASITGWFVGFENSVSQIRKDEAYLPGFKFGVEMNDNFLVGFAVKSLSWYESQIKDDNLFGEPTYLSGGYVGLYFEASPFDQKMIHISFPFIAGCGGASYITTQKYPEMDEDEPDFSRKVLSESPFFVIEPGVNAEVNLTGFMKIYCGYSYRWISALNLEHTSKNAFSGSSFNFGIKLGKF